MATTTLHGTPFNTNGNLPAVGSTAPDFVLVDADLADVGLDRFAGQRKVLNIVPSLDTPTCQASTRRFNEAASKLDNTVVLIVSADLPFAQKRFCETDGLDDVVPLALMRNKDFASDYGVLLVDGPLAGVTARAVLVLDEDNVVKHAELVTEIADEPNYDAALAAL